MARTKTKSPIWLPKRSRWFNAVEKQRSHLLPAGPFKCKTVVRHDGRPVLVDAVDADGDGWQFKLSEFWLFACKGKEYD